jgi:hypothetical protein
MYSFEVSFLNFVQQRGTVTRFENPSRHKHKRCAQCLARFFLSLILIVSARYFGSDISSCVGAWLSFFLRESDDGEQRHHRKLLNQYGRGSVSTVDGGKGDCWILSNQFV